ncbi:hypothetical protein THIOM_004779 [Candidatus Thiomargarita nelsonii]|uniref:Uncharacterized protein n=1 Tax=Candidatus Thiomargarita nelsonii TaxID=1003181 RepID=A0A176RV24_9GAMM|nr:hypothetical protein THIOM_004779 [Candidatus Thiomargarita nelsonii]
MQAEISSTMKTRVNSLSMVLKNLPVPFESDRAMCSFFIRKFCIKGISISQLVLYFSSPNIRKFIITDRFRS